MKVRSILASAVATLALIVSPAVYASPVNPHAPLHAFLGKTKNINISFRNDSGAPLELKAGDSVIKLEVGQTMKLQLPAGTRVVASTSTANIAAGAMITEVATYLEGATIGIK